MTDVSATDYYRSWTAYSSLQEAAAAANYRSVWDALGCRCCHLPGCWRSQPSLTLPEQLLARIRWYDHVRLPDHGPDRELQAHFVGHHQRSELVLLALKPAIDRIYSLLEHVSIKEVDESVAAEVIAECRYGERGWIAVGELVKGVARMDRMEYLAYVPRLAGVSGGNSPLMVPLTTRTAMLETMFKNLSDEELAAAIQHRTPAGRVAEAFIDFLDALSRCWLDHVVTATTVIGLTCGTKGTPNTILVDRVLRRLHTSRLLQALGSLRAPITGVGLEMRQLHDYVAYPLADHYLDLFDDPGPEFGTHSVGWLPKEYERAKSDYLEIRRKRRTGIFDHYYQETRPMLCQELCRLFCVDDGIGFGFGSNVTEVMMRIVASVPTVATRLFTVSLAENEFVALQRAATLLTRSGGRVRSLSCSELKHKLLAKHPDASEEKKQEGKTIDEVVFVSLVNSCTQSVNDLGWILSVPEETLFIIDVTQAIANIPFSHTQLSDIVQRPNVFVVGSLVKHARCGENLGFMAYATNCRSLIREPFSGWTAYMEGLRENRTVDDSTNRLLYTKGYEWDGGTPGWVESAYVAARILKAMPPVELQHEYVQSLKALVLKRIYPSLSEYQRQAITESNTLCIPAERVLEDDLPYGIDYKVIGSTSFLRIGIGIHNLPYHLDSLIEMLEKTKIFEI